MPDQTSPRPEGPEPTVKTDLSGLIGWGIFILVAAGFLIYRAFAGGGC